MHGKRNLAWLALVLAIIYSCGDRNKRPDGGRSDSDTLLLYLDTNQIRDFVEKNPCIKRDKLVAFYQKRNFAWAWISSLGVHESAGSFMNILDNDTALTNNSRCYSRLQSLFNTQFHRPAKNNADHRLRELELLLTANFIAYAQNNLSGINEGKLAELHGQMDRKELNYEDRLGAFMEGKAYGVSNTSTVAKRFELLKDYLEDYERMERKSVWPVLPEHSRVLQLNDTSSLLLPVKKLLYATGDLKDDDGSTLFDADLQAAVKNFQQRHGLTPDGKISEETYKAMRVPIRERIKQMLVNLERYRWAPDQLEDHYVAINIPDFKLHAFHGKHLEWSCDVIVGKAQVNQTIIFNDLIEYVVFRPYWNIPRSILTEETLPAIRKDRDYIVSHDLEVVDQSGAVVSASDVDWNNENGSFPYRIRQAPGENNSLGLIKFLFPNSYGIYLHDTPQKSLFNEAERDFSHGCVRVKEPVKLAAFLLNDKKKWNEETIFEKIQSGPETYVKLEKKVPVFIAYFTAWVDRKGALNFRNDIYGHDEKMKQLLFVN